MALEFLVKVYNLKQNNYSSQWKELRVERARRDLQLFNPTFSCTWQY